MDMDQPADRATRFYRHIISHPYWVMGVFAVITLLAASQLPRIRLQTDLRELLPRDKTYVDDERIRETFNIHDSIFVALVQEPTVINVPAMEFMQKLVRRIEGLDGVYRVRSVFNQDDIEKTSAGIANTRLIRNVDAQSVERLKERLRNFKALIGVLVSKDQSCLAMIVDVKSSTNMSVLVHAIQDAAEHGPARPPGVKVYLAGMPVNEGVLGDYVMRDLNLMLPVVFLVVMITLYLSYRSFTLVGVALVEVLVVDVVTLGLMGFLGVPLHMVHGTMPVVLMALAVADEIHIFDGYFAERATGDGDNRACLLRTMRVMWKPVTLTSVTTALAFLSFLTSTMHPFRTYGVFTAVGVMVAMAFSLLVTPAVLGLRPARSRARLSGAASSRWLGALGGFMARRRRTFALVIVIIIAVAGLGASRVYVQDSWMDNFDKSSPVRQAFEMVRQKLYGPMLLYLELDTGRPDGIKDPDFLRRLAALQEDMATVPMVGGTLSVEQILQQANKVFTGHDEPPTKAGASAFFLMNLEGHSYDDLWCYPYQKCVVMIFCRTDDYATGKANYNGCAGWWWTACPAPGQLRRGLRALLPLGGPAAEQLRPQLHRQRHHGLPGGAGLLALAALQHLHRHPHPAGGAAELRRDGLRRHTVRRGHQHVQRHHPGHRHRLRHPPRQQDGAGAGRAWGGRRRWRRPSPPRGGPSCGTRWWCWPAS